LHAVCYTRLLGPIYRFRIDLKLIRTFRAVADAGGFSLAEVELRMTKSAISKQVSDLEVRLGVRLCHRSRSGFALTAEGESIYRASTRLLGEIESFRAELNAQKGVPSRKGITYDSGSAPSKKSGCCNFARALLS
jgi:DNA-binding transcriptional LysR family regulator